ASRLRWPSGDRIAAPLRDLRPKRGDERKSRQLSTSDGRAKTVAEIAADRLVQPPGARPHPHGEKEGCVMTTKTITWHTFADEALVEASRDHKPALFYFGAAPM